MLKSGQPRRLEPYAAILERNFRLLLKIDAATPVVIDFDLPNEIIRVAFGPFVYEMQVGSDDNGFEFIETSNPNLTLSFAFPLDWIALGESDV